MYMNVHRQKMEETQMSNNLWMDVQIVVYPHNRILSNKNKQTIDGCRSIGEFQNDYVQEEAEKQGAHTVTFHLYKILQNEN